MGGLEPLFSNKGLYIGESHEPDPDFECWRGSAKQPLG